MESNSCQNIDEKVKKYWKECIFHHTCLYPEAYVKSYSTAIPVLGMNSFPPIMGGNEFIPSTETILK